VNTGRYVGKKNLEDTILKTNLEAVQEIAYQLRLRNCGGIIILDLIDMERDENKQRVYRALEDALAKDRARPTIMKISDLGLVEMTRKRTRDTIIRTLCESCTHCEGKGFIKSKQTVAYEVMREVEREGIDRDITKVLVQAHSDVIDILAIDERETLDQLERRYRKQIYLQAVTDFHQEQFEVTADKKPKANRDRHGEYANSSGDRDRGDRNRHRQPQRQYSKENALHSSPLMVVVNPDASGTVASPVAVVKPKPVVAVIAPLAEPIPRPQISAQSDSVVMDVAAGGQSQSPASVAHDNPYEEEDRLAFLRAQAAQDAALARLGNGGNTSGTHSPLNRPGRGAIGDGRPNGERNGNNTLGNGGGGRRPPPRGRRGPKFRRMNDRNAPPRGRPQPYGYGEPGQASFHSGPAGSANSAGPTPSPVAPVTRAGVPDMSDATGHDTSHDGHNSGKVSGNSDQGSKGGNES
jgi:hypothetical protein